MPIGVIINALSVLIGGTIGGILGNNLSEKFKTELNMIFGLCSISMGIFAIAPMKNMAAVILSVVLGTVLGFAVHFGMWINNFSGFLQRIMFLFFPIKNKKDLKSEATNTLVTIIVLFCASGTGIYGSLESGMTGEHSVLISKSILDFFTAIIFACNLGYIVSIIAIPQFIILFILYVFSKIIFPLITPEMILDFKACGGILMVATGFRMVQLKMFPTADMIPAMLLVMPLSWMWTNWIIPLL